MIPVSNPPAPPTPEQLLAMLKDPLKKLIADDVDGDSAPEREWVLRQIRKSSLYLRGLQYSAPFLYGNGYTEFNQNGSPISNSTGDGGGTGLYDYVQNIYRGYGRKFCAVLGQRSPNVKAVADDPGDDAAIKATRVADNAAAILRAMWDVDIRNMELALCMWSDGTAFGYTPYVKNGRKYGYSTEPKMEVREVATGPATFHCMQCGATTPEEQVNPSAPACPQCGAPLGPESYREPETMQSPVVTGTVQYEKGAVELELMSMLFVSVPFSCRGLDDAPWLSYEYEVPRGRLLQMYPELRGKGFMDAAGGDTSSSSGVAQTTRETVANPIGIPTPHRSNRWSYRRTWLRPEMFECVRDEGHRRVLLETYPSGLKITLVQGQIVELEDEDLSDVWAFCKPETSQYIYADGIGFDLMPVQDLINDCSVNIPAETIERGLAVTFANPQVLDIDQWSQHQAKAAEVIPALAMVGDTLANSFFQLPPTKFSDQIMPWGVAMESMGQQIVGVVPEIFGGGNADTARQAEINKNAAMMQLGTTWTYARKFWEKVYSNGVRQLAKWGAGVIRHGNFVVDMSELQDAGYHFEADEAMPMTWAQQRDFLMWLLEKPPQLLDAYGVTHPNNVERNKALLGMTDYYTPGLDEYDKTMETIQKLSEAAPIQKPGDDGSMQLTPSIEPDEFEDDHASVVKMVQAWSNSLPGRSVRESNPDGYANVIAFGKAHAEMAQDPPPPPPPPKVSLTGKLQLDANQTAQILNNEGISTPPPVGPITNSHGQIGLPGMDDTGGQQQTDLNGQPPAPQSSGASDGAQIPTLGSGGGGPVAPPPPTSSGVPRDPVPLKPLSPQ